MQHGYMMHGESVYEEQVHVPLLMRWPGRLPAGTKIAHPVVMNDLLPTLLSFAGIETNLKDSPGIDLIEEGNRLSADRSIFLHRRHYVGMPLPAALPGATRRCAPGWRRPWPSSMR